MELNPLLQAQAKPISKSAAVGLRRKCACGQHAVGGSACDECGKKEETLRRRAANSPEQKSRRAEVPPVVREVLRSPGRPLDAATRAFFEPLFGHDFSHVRVHTDVRAAELAQAVNALAYTTGRDVVFGAGLYTPGTREGQKLLAHELAHVVQQRGGGAGLHRAEMRVGEANSSFERSKAMTRR